MKTWWRGLSRKQRELFIMCGLLGIFVVGMSVGTFGACNLVLWEPLMHIGFAFGLGAVVTGLFYGASIY